MNINEAINVINAFKNESVREIFKDLEKLKKSSATYDFESIFSAAKVIKEASAQIDEIVHASGIMLAQSVWLDKNEEADYLSLGAGNHKGKFDFETNLRIAEFKFGKWNERSANGVRRRGYFSNYVSLLTANTDKSKYFVVEDKNAFIKFMNGTAKWKNVLSKNPSGFIKFQKFLIDNKVEYLETVGEIYNQFNDLVTVIDFKEIIKTQTQK